MTSKATKKDLKGIVDQLPESELQTARRFLEYLRDTCDPVLQAFLKAPEDDVPETEEERAAVPEAYEALARGDVVSDEELKRELGL